jgi:predicted N-formylglutamate amidohydrolase
MFDGVETLLGQEDPHPVAVERPAGRSPYFLTCDHAGRQIPRQLGQLGLAAADLTRHIAWDVGAAEVARGLSERLDATLVMQSYSRLVIDCNRPTHGGDSISLVSEVTEIPGNRDLHPGHAAARAREIFHPYHDHIAEALDTRQADGLESLLVAVHSFTPVYKGQTRPWHVGALYNRDRRLAEILMELMVEDRGLVVGDNEPYSVDDESDYTIPQHGEKRVIPHVLIEIRHDLIEDTAGQSEWAERLADWLSRALDRLRDGGGAA